MADYNINAVTRRIVYTGSAGVGPYAFSFEILVNTDVDVYFNTTLLTLATDYTVTINANGTGSVTLIVGSSIASTPTLNDRITIVGARDIERTTDFVTAGELRASALNEQLDALTIFDQQLLELSDRAIRAPVTDPTSINMELPAQTDRADKILKFDSNGNVAVESASVLAGAAIVGANFTNNVFTGTGTQTAFTLTVAPGSKNNAQVYIDGVYQLKSSFSVSGTTLTFTEAPPLNAQIEVVIGSAIDTLDADSGNINYNQGGTGAQTRTVESKLQEFVSVKDFGATGDGVTDDTSAIQAAINEGLSSGVNVFFPGGRYRTTSQLTIDNSSSSLDPTDGGKMLSLRGASPASSMIVADHNGIALSFTGGSSAGWHTYFYIDGIGLTKSNKGRDSGSVGIQFDDCAYAQIQRFEVSYFEYGIKGTDILSSSFVDGTIRLNNYGFQFQRDNRSRPNNIAFRGVVTINNQIWGGQVIEPGAFDYIGGSIESNGYTGTPGDTNSWGIDIQNGGTEAASAVNFSGVYIENNNGRADVKILSDTQRASYNFSGCSFLRFADITSRYTTNNIYFNNSIQSRLTVSGCGFKEYAPYTSSVSRPFISSGDAQVFDGGGNIFLDTSNGNIPITRAIFAPLGINHQLPYASLPDETENRNGIQYCSDGTGSLLPSLAVSDGTAWWQIPLGQFSGRVATAGTALKLPRGWTSSKTGTGVYTITHNLGLASNTYSVVATPSGSPGTGYCSGMALSGNTFEIYFANTSGTATDMDFNFNMQII